MAILPHNYKSKVQDTWEFIEINWSPNMIIEGEKDWENTLLNYSKHKNCKVCYYCRICCTPFCVHLKNSMCCGRLGICIFCDSDCQPYLCNPINFKYMEKYCPYI